MSWIIAGLLALAVFSLAGKNKFRLPVPLEPKALTIGIGIALGLALTFLLTGRIGGAVVCALAAGAGFIRYGQLNKLKDTTGRQSTVRSSMSRQEALQILGLTDTAGPEDVRSAHRRLIQALHPDQGGSDYLAAKINHARDTLLNTL